MEVKDGSNVVLKCEYDGLERGTLAEEIKYCVPEITEKKKRSAGTLPRKKKRTADLKETMPTI